MATAGTLVVNLIARTSVFDRKMMSSRGRMKNFSRQTALASSAIRKFGLVIGAAGAGLGVIALTKNMAAFSKQMAMVSTMLTEQTARFLPEFRKGIRQMSVEFGEGTATLSKGLFDILSASVKASKAMNVLRISAQAAKGGFATTALAADAITTVLNSYNLEADRAIDVSDKLFAIVKRGKITFEELAPNIGKVASLANTAGLSFDEVGAAISTMTRAGLQSEIAITSLRAVLNSFLKPMDTAAALAKDKFGFALNTATLRAEGLTGVLQKLKKATAEELAVIFPNIRALAGFSAAISNVEGNALDMRLMLESAGRTQEAFAKAAVTSDTALKRVGQSAKNLGISLTDLIEVPVTAFFNRLAGEMSKVSSWFDKISKKSKPFFADRKRDAKAFVNDMKAAAGAVRGLFSDPTLTPGNIKNRFLQNFAAGQPSQAPSAQGPSTSKAAVIPSTINAAMRDVGSAQKIISETAKKATKDVDKMLESLNREVEITGRLNETRERSREIVEFQIAAEKAFGVNTEKTINLISEYSAKLKNLEKAQRLAEIANKIEDAFASAFTDMIMGAGKAEDAILSLANSILKLIIQQTIAGPIAAGITGAFFGPTNLNAVPAGAATPGIASVAHSGGIVGRTSFPQRAVSPGLFNNAPRLHNGLGAGEFPAILQRGEQVIPRGGSSGPTVVINIDNRSSQEVQADQSDVTFDGEKFIVEAVIKDFHGNGPIRSLFSS